MSRLPIYEIEDELCSKLKKEPRLVLSAPTGSGKSTQVPQMMMDNGLLGDGEVVILQPRRLAARMLADRVASERNVKIGSEVGYQIRFENRTSKDTRIRFVTEAILLRQMVNDPTLEGISAILFDEFHERHIYGDITLARAVSIQKDLRPDLKIIVMSATLEIETLQNFLQPCSVVRSEGRTFPVSVEYWKKSVSPETTPVWDAAAEAFEMWASRGEAGDVLIFMPGNFEINRTIQSLQGSKAAKDHIILPLHGELPPDQQDLAVSPAAKPRIIVSTNVAETSLTIDGIRLVIDSGLARIAHFDVNRGINTLHIHRISQSSADQRTGRAGRTQEGHCIRLWSEKDHSHRPVQDKAEIHRLELSETLLTLKCTGVGDLTEFGWFETPVSQSLERGLTLLHDLGALDRKENVTEVGRKMQAFPTHPRYARLLLAADEFECVYQAALIAALTQGRNILIPTNDRRIRENRAELLGDTGVSDFLILMRAWKYASSKNFNTGACRSLGIHAATCRQVKPLFDQFSRIAESQGLDASPKRINDENLQRCLLIAFSDRLARRMDRGTLRCELVHGRRGDLSRDSIIQDAPLFVAAEIQEIEGRDKQVQTLLSGATAIEEEWLIQHFPEDFSEKEEVFIDSTTRRVSAVKSAWFRDLRIRSSGNGDPTPEAAAALLAAEIIKGTVSIKKWDQNIEAWILRVNQLSQACPELEIPIIDEEARLQILTEICLGAYSFKDVRELEVRNSVRQWLNQNQQNLVEKFAPEKVKLTNGRHVRVEYTETQDPYIAVRMQDLFGVKTLPDVYMGRKPLVVHILAPNFRPVQVTQNLAGFWTDHYPARKKELQRKYPKHSWPDDPTIPTPPQRKKNSE